MDHPLTSDDAEARAVSPAEAARMLGVSGKTVQRLINNGQLRSFNILRTRRIRISAIREYLERQEAAANQPIPFTSRR